MKSKFTKAQLRHQTQVMTDFVRMKMVRVLSKDVYKLRNVSGFVPVVCYAMAIPAEDEIGSIGDTRYFSGKQRVWKP